MRKNEPSLAKIGVDTAVPFLFHMIGRSFHASSALVLCSIFVLVIPVVCHTDQLVACFQSLEFVFSRRPRQGGSGEPRYLHFLKTYSGIAAAAADSGIAVAAAAAENETIFNQIQCTSMFKFCRYQSPPRPEHGQHRRHGPTYVAGPRRDGPRREPPQGRLQAGSECCPLCSAVNARPEHRR